MKKVLSVCLAFALFLGLLPMNVSASEVEYNALQEMEDAIRQNSKAVLKDSDGNVLEVLDLEVSVEPVATTRAIGAGRYYKVTCATRAKNDPFSDDASRDGYTAALTMTCKDVFGPENQLVSVYGYFGANESDTYNRLVGYASYNMHDKQTNISPDTSVGSTFSFAPSDFTGYTFRAWGSAIIYNTGNKLELYVTTTDV